MPRARPGGAALGHDSRPSSRCPSLSKVPVKNQRRTLALCRLHDSRSQLWRKQQPTPELVDELLDQHRDEGDGQVGCRQRQHSVHHTRARAAVRKGGQEERRSHRNARRSPLRSLRPFFSLRSMFSRHLPLLLHTRAVETISSRARRMRPDRPRAAPRLLRRDFLEASRARSSIVGR